MPCTQNTINMIVCLHLTRMQSMVHHRKYPPLFTFDLDLGVMVTQNVAEYLPHHVTHGPGKFEAATSNGKGDAFKRKYIL